MSFDQKLLEGILVCTKCRSPLVREGESLVCAGAPCRLRFGIQNDIPNMLLEDAAPVVADEWGTLMKHHGRDPVTGALVTSR